MRFRKGETIFEQGDPAFGFYCLCTGVVKLWRRMRNGRCQILALLREPGFLVGIEALGAERRDYTATALAESRLFFIAREDFGRLPGLELLNALVQLLRVMEQRLIDTLGRGARERLARLLLAQPCALTLQELAGLSGLSVKHTCRVLKRFEQREWICHDGRIVEIREPQALESSL